MGDSARLGSRAVRPYLGGERMDVQRRNAGKPPARAEPRPTGRRQLKRVSQEYLVEFKGGVEPVVLDGITPNVLERIHAMRSVAANSNTPVRCS